MLLNCYLFERTLFRAIFTPACQLTGAGQVSPSPPPSPASPAAANSKNPAPFVLRSLLRQIMFLSSLSRKRKIYKWHRDGVKVLSDYRSQRSSKKFHNILVLLKHTVAYHQTWNTAQGYPCYQGVTKRCRLSCLTHAWGGLSQWVQLCTWSPNKLWRSNYIFNLCLL
jgi:hypothetical protein